MRLPIQVPASVQAAIRQFPISWDAVAPVLASVLTFASVATAVAAAIAIGAPSTPAPHVQPRGENSVIQVVTEDGRTAGICSLGGLLPEMMHYTDRNSVYYWKLEPGEKRIDASCPNVGALSSGKVRLEGHATVNNFDKPQVVKITVR